MPLWNVWERSHDITSSLPSVHLPFPFALFSESPENHKPPALHNVAPVRGWGAELCGQPVKQMEARGRREEERQRGTVVKEPWWYIPPALQYASSTVPLSDTSTPVCVRRPLALSGTSCALHSTAVTLSAWSEKRGDIFTVFAVTDSCSCCDYCISVTMWFHRMLI